MSFEHEIEIPFDVVTLDGYPYVVPHGLPIETERLVKAGVVKILLINRNVTVVPVEPGNEKEKYESHPLFPADEFLSVAGTSPLITRFSNRMLHLLDITMEKIHDYYSQANPKLLDVDPSQLSISKGRLWIGEVPSEKMVVVWTGSGFAVAPTSLELAPPEEAVEEVVGSVIGNRFRCKYGMLNILRR